uniref:Uncharacterized protein n=1 Tax=Rhizophora mucronata TaxID=61149 RepID=A0A2P2PHS0_RHIMU
MRERLRYLKCLITSNEFSGLKLL